MHRHMNSTRERPRVRDEVERRLHAAGALGDGGDFRHVPVRERFIRKEIALAERVVRRRFQFTARAGAAGDADGVEIRLDDAELQKRHDAQKKRGRKTTGMPDMLRCFGDMFRKRARELGHELLRAVR